MIWFIRDWWYFLGRTDIGEHRFSGGRVGPIEAIEHAMGAGRWRELLHDN